MPTGKEESEGHGKVPPSAPAARFSSTVPTHSMGSMDAAARQYGLAAPRKREGDAGASPPRPVGAAKAGSPAIDGDQDLKDVSNSYQSNQLLHKCESCSKVYRHPSCLVKHRWVGIRTDRRSTPCTGRRRPNFL